jgi:hypothetical protein
VSDTVVSEVEVGRWLSGKVLEATALEAWRDIIPIGADLPAVRYTPLVSRDVRTVDQQVPLTRIEYLVLVVGDGNLEDLAAAAELLDAGLHRATGSTSKVLVLSCTRDRPYGMTESEQGRTIRHLGGFYVVQARPVG